MKFLLLGPGGVGVYFCGRAALGGTKVEVLPHSGFDEISEKGYSIQSIAGDFHFKPDKVLKNSSSISGDFDAVILSSKILPEIDRTKLLAPVKSLPGNPPIVLIQNGIGIEEEIATAFPDNEIISVIAYIGVSRNSATEIVHRGAGKLLMGSFNTPKNKVSAVEKVANAFRAGGIECTVSNDIILERWRKLLWNLPFNPLSVVAGGLHTGELCDGGEIEKLCSALMDEVIAVANASGVKLTRKMADEQIEYTRNFPPYRTSMLQDFDAGKFLEVDAIIGNAVKIAQKHNISVPLMSCVSVLLRSIDRKLREQKNQHC